MARALDMLEKKLGLEKMGFDFVKDEALEELKANAAGVPANPIVPGKFQLHDMFANPPAAAPPPGRLPPIVR